MSGRECIAIFYLSYDGAKTADGSLALFHIFNRKVLFLGLEFQLCISSKQVAIGVRRNVLERNHDLSSKQELCKHLLTWCKET